MIRLFVRLFFLGLLCTSCQQRKVEIARARAYYDSVNFQIDVNRDLQQNLINKAALVVLTLRDDRAATIDIPSMQNLFDSAREANLVRQHNIEKITEVDGAINYKGKALDYVQQLNAFYDKEFKEFIVLLQDKQQDRFQVGAALLKPKLELIKEKGIALNEAQAAFNDKYPVDADGAVRTKPDYELVKFSDFQYQPVHLKQGEEIKLISYSGGDDCEDQRIYYKQFIGIVAATGDTVRILAPCQTYDRDHPARTGYYQGDLAGMFQNNKTAQSFIVFNKHQADLEKKDFKTTIGMLSFK